MTTKKTAPKEKKREVKAADKAKVTATKEGKSVSKGKCPVLIEVGPNSFIGGIQC